MTDRADSEYERRHRPRVVSSRIVRYFDPLTLSAFLIIPHIFWGVLLLSFDIFSHPSYALMAAIAPQWWWGTLHMLVASVRLYVVLSVHRGVSPPHWIDRISAYVSILCWWYLTLQFIAAGAGKTAFANTTVFAIGACIAGAAKLGRKR